VPIDDESGRRVSLRATLNKNINFLDVKGIQPMVIGDRK
jgi:hypothetical protein